MMIARGSLELTLLSFCDDGYFQTDPVVVLKLGYSSLCTNNSPINCKRQLPDTFDIDLSIHRRCVSAEAEKGGEWTETSWWQSSRENMLCVTFSCYVSKIDFLRGKDTADLPRSESPLELLRPFLFASRFIEYIDRERNIAEIPSSSSREDQSRFCLEYLFVKRRGKLWTGERNKKKKLQTTLKVDLSFLFVPERTQTSNTLD